MGPARAERGHDHHGGRRTDRGHDAGLELTPVPSRPVTVGLYRRTAVHATLLTAGIAQPLLQLYGSNLAVFTSARMSGADVVWFGLLVLLAPIGVAAALDVLAGLLPTVAASTARNTVTFLAALPLCSLLVRSVPGPWSVALLFAAALAAAVAALVSRVHGVQTWIAWMSPLAPAVLALFLFSSQSVVWEAKAEVVTVQTTAAPTGDTDAGVRATAPEDVSVLWLQLDEAPLWPLLASDGTINARRFPGFAALAGKSTWYRNALGVSQTTVDAVPAMLTGRAPVTGRAPTYSNYRRNLFALAYGHRALDVHEIATALCPREACSTVSVSGNDAIANGGTVGATLAPSTTVPAVPKTTGLTSVKDPVDRAAFLHDALVVLGHKLLPRGLRDRLPPIDEGWGGFGADRVGDTGSSDAPASEPAGTTTSVVGPAITGPTGTDGATTTTENTRTATKRNTVRGWERDGARSQVPVVRDMVARAARSSLATIHFAHVLLPHRPWQLTPSMQTTRFVSTDKRDAGVEDRVRDEYQAFLAQYAATDSLVLDLVNDMKRSANWDRTMIIVTADHGIAFEPGESKRKEINTARTDTLEEIYRVPLFVKWPDQREPAVSDCPVQGFDLLPSIVQATGLDAGWRFDGSDIRTECPVRTKRTVWWDKGRTTLSSGFAAARASASRFDGWVDSDGDQDGIAKVSGTEDWFAVPVPVSPTQETTVRGWTLRDAPLFRSVPSQEFGRVPLQVDGDVRVSAAPGKGAVGLLVMDGRVVAVLPEVGTMRAGRNAWRSLLLPSSLTPGKHSPVLFVARGTPALPTLMLVGPPG